MSIHFPRNHLIIANAIAKIGCDLEEAQQFLSYKNKIDM